jgi:type I restriction enzyme S subunit
MSTRDTLNIPEKTTTHPRYDAYKDSGVEWLGEIPESWQAIRLRFLLVTSPSKSEVKGRDPETEVSFVPMEAVGEEGGLDLSETKPIEGVIDGYTYFRDGDVVVAKITPCFENGKGALATGLQSGVGFGTTELHVLRPGDHLEARFLFYATMSHPFRKIGESTMYGAGGQQRVSDDFIQNLNWPIPPLPEQRAIAAYLDRETERIDALVAKKERLIELLEEKRTALISHAVTKGLDDDAEMKDSGVEWLDEIPAGWETRKVKYAASIQRGVFSHRPRNDPRLYEGDHPFIQTGDIAGAGKFIDSYEQTLNDEGLMVSRKFPSGTLVMTIAANIGDLAITKFAACFPDSIVSMTPNPDLSQEYLYYVLTAMRDSLRKASVANTQLNLNVERIGNLYMTVPPRNEQRRIVATLNDETVILDRLASKVRDGIDRLKEYRTALVSSAVTGRIDVRGD